MKNTRTAIEKMGVIPRLKLAEQVTDDEGKKKGVRSTGPHRVKFLSDKPVMGHDPVTMKERQEMEFTVEESGVKKIWRVPLFDKQARPNYLLERLMEISEGEEVILEVKKSGAKNYTNVKRLSPMAEVENEDEDDQFPGEDEIEKTLAAEAEKGSETLFP